VDVMTEGYPCEATRHRSRFCAARSGLACAPHACPTFLCPGRGSAAPWRGCCDVAHAWPHARTCMYVCMYGCAVCVHTCAVGTATNDPSVRRRPSRYRLQNRPVRLLPIPSAHKPAFTTAESPSSSHALLSHHKRAPPARIAC
jgi:hypothetical protein